jgi:large subunit ribosomal protein L5
MWSFLDRLIHVAIPRIKDFRGLAKTFDEKGNYNVGFREQAIFPEIELERLEHNQGMQVTIVFSHSNPEKSLVMLRALGMPIKN